MRRKLNLLLALLMLTCALGTVQADDDVHISGRIMLNFGTPPPMVWMPELSVYLAFGSPYPLFFYMGEYYYFHDHHWYRAPGYGGPWVGIELHHLPRHLRSYHDDDWPRWQKRADDYYRKGDRHEHPPFPAYRDRRDGGHDRPRDRGRDGRHD